jgi:hypothetical protein
MLAVAQAQKGVSTMRLFVRIPLQAPVVQYCKGSFDSVRKLLRKFLTALRMTMVIETIAKRSSYSAQSLP